MMKKPRLTKINNIEKSLQSAEEHCQRNGSKLTKKRRQILSLLLGADRAISAYELIELFNDQFEHKPPAMSVYRILDYLVSFDLIHKVNAANKFIACTQIHNMENHGATQLLFCQQCQQVQETPLNTTVYEGLLDEIKKSGNQLCSQQLEFTCICNACLENSQSYKKSISA